MNLKKCHLYYDKVEFLGFVVLIKNISIEEEKIEVVKTQSKPKLGKNNQLFIDFVNFYQWFIKKFNKIALLLVLILKTTFVKVIDLIDKRSGNTNSSSSVTDINAKNLSKIKINKKSTKFIKPDFAKVNSSNLNRFSYFQSQVYIYLPMKSFYLNINSSLC